MKPILISSLLLLAVLQSYAQEVGVGQWRDHLPYREAFWVAEGDDYAWAATEHSLFSYHKTDKSVDRMSKVWGLSDVGVSCMRYHEGTKTLLIGYTNGNLDLLQNEQVFNQAAIKISNVLGDKIVNNITFEGNLAYLSCGFGIVVLDLDRKEIKDTYFIGDEGALVNVTDIAIGDGMLMASTTEGLYQALIDDPDLTNFSSWTKDLTVPKPNAHFDQAYWFNGGLLLNFHSGTYNSDTLFHRIDGNWTTVAALLQNNIHSIEPKDDNLLFALNGAVSEYDASWTEVSKVFDYGTGTAASPQHAIAGTDAIWIADRGQGMVYSINAFNNTVITPEGPFKSNAASVRIQNNKVVVAAGALNGSRAPTFSTDGMYFLENDEWTYLNAANSQDYIDLDVRDLIDVAIDPRDQTRVFAASYGGGLLETVNGQVMQRFSTANSTLEPTSLDSSAVQCTGLQFDINNNLWVVASGSNKVLSMMDPTGDWITYDFSTVMSEQGVDKVMISQNNYKWINMPRGGGVLVFDDNFTPFNTDDDQMRLVGGGAGNGNLPSTSVFSMAEGLDGEIWFGTDKGVAVMFTPGNVFTEQDFDAQQITVSFDGYNGYLLEAETVTAIEIDGENRKWVGTDGAGVFLLSPDGTEQILHFTKDDSPLLSNSIQDIAINHITGEVFISTSKGLIGYKANATGNFTTFDDIYAYPNPVEPGYTGMIAIKGIRRNTSVKITDINGNLVYETNSEGGQAVWDGNTLYGEPVTTGVYLVFCADQNGRETAVTKVLVVR